MLKHLPGKFLARNGDVMEVIEVDDSTWESLIEKGKKAAAVMFYSSTCAYCAQIEPYFIEYAKEFGDMVFAKLNVMTSSTTASRYGVMSTPTFKFFCSGRAVQELVGSVYPPLLKKTIEDVLEHGEACIARSTRIDYYMTGYA
ncbi:MAG: thioredoxin family protein [Thermoplasmata archaeon]